MDNIEAIASKTGISANYIIEHVCDYVEDVSSIKCAYTSDGFVPLYGEECQEFRLAVDEALENWTE